MNLSDFKAGSWIQQVEYRSFSPEKINQEWNWSDATLTRLLDEATHKLGELNAFSLSVPNVDVFIQMHVTKEATTSSRIEGTRTELEEALQDEKDLAPEKRDDWQEVHNYISAMTAAVERLQTLPLSTRLLCEAHAILLQGVRGEHKLPGEFRRSQNWIGGGGLKDAFFIPPHYTEVHDLMSDLEKFLHNEMLGVPPLIRIGIAHYQFETIHPFLDGNGRIGRLLITLYLVGIGRLTKPTLYLSDYFEKHKTLYYENLTGVRTGNNLVQWLRFFLVALIETATKGIAAFQKVLALREQVEGGKILTLGKKILRAKSLVTLLYRLPVLDAATVSSSLHVTPATANSLIGDFVRLGILREATGFRRNRIFVFEDYLSIFR